MWHRNAIVKAYKDLGWIFFNQAAREPLDGFASSMSVCFVLQPTGRIQLVWPYKEKWTFSLELLQHLLPSLPNASMNNLETKHHFQSWSHKSSKVAP